MRGIRLILVIAGLTLAGAALAAAAPDHRASSAQSRAEEQETLLISRALDGGIPNGPSTNAVISNDRRWARIIAFQSEASDLVNGDTNGVSDVFFIKRTGRFRNTGPGAGGPWVGGATRLVSRGLDGAPADGRSFDPAVDGAFRARPRCVAFLSEATNLVRGDTNGKVDAFLSRGPGRRIRRVSLPGNRQSALDTSQVAISGDCSRVAFVNGNRLYVWRRGRVRRIRTRGRAADPSFATGLTNDLVFGARRGIYLSRGATRRPRRVVVGGRNPAYNSIKRRVVTYEKRRRGVTQIYARDLGRRERLLSRRGGARGNGNSRDPVIGNSGYYVTFESEASNLGLNALGRAGDSNRDPDVYLYTDVRNITLVQSVEEKAVPVPGGGVNPSMSFYANYIVFDSPAPLGRERGEADHQVFMRYLGGL